MRRPARVVWLAAVVSIAVWAVPSAVGADQSSCQSGTGPVGGDPSTAGGVNIRVTTNDSTVWCSAQVIEANSNVADGTNYPVRATTQSPNYNPVSNAISVSELLTLAGVNPVSVDHTEIMRLSGSWSVLENADLVDPSARFEGGLAPIFWINGSETQYLRPLRSPSDTNGDDQIVASAGSPLDLYVYSGPLLSVAATATPNQVAVKQPVTFTAHVTNPTAADGTLIYKWIFQDGSTATGASVTHSYAVSGTWDPVVTVQGKGNDSGGASQPIPVTVGSVPKSANPGRPGGANHDKQAHIGGPSHSKGNTANTAPTHKRTSGSSANNTSGNLASPAQSPSPPAQNAPTPQPRSSTPQVSPTASAHTREPNARRAIRRVRSRPTPGATVVDGRLIADVIPVSVAQLATENNPATQAHAPSARLGGGSLTPLAGIAGGCVIVLLLGSGAAAELRSQRRYVTPAGTA
jgi:hypothetical protein